MIIGAVIYVRCTACAGIELYLFSYCTEGVPDGTLTVTNASDYIGLIGTNRKKQPFSDEIGGFSD